LLMNAGSTVESCAAAAAVGGFTLFALQYGRQCFAGNSLAAAVQYGLSTACSTPCTSNSSEICGSAYVNSVYTLGEAVACESCDSRLHSETSHTSNYVSTAQVCGPSSAQQGCDASSCLMPHVQSKHVAALRSTRASRSCVPLGLGTKPFVSPIEDPMNGIQADIAWVLIKANFAGFCSSLLSSNVGTSMFDRRSVVGWHVVGSNACQIRAMGFMKWWAASCGVVEHIALNTTLR